MKFSFLGRSESPAVQLYGKLPIAKDYLRVGCGEGAARDLREWLDRTFGSARSDDDELRLSEPLRFLGQGAREPLQGCLWPSSDAGEHRSFPFTVFVERREKALQADLAAGNLSEAEAVWRVLDETRERCLGASDGQELLGAERGRELEVGAYERIGGAPADLDAWLDALFGDARLDGLHELFARLDELARARHAGPWRLPLVRDLPARDQVIGWVVVLRGVGALAPDGVPTLFFPPRPLVAGAGTGTLVVAREPLDDARVAWLTRAAGEGALGPGDFSRADDDARGSGAAPPEGSVWLRDALRDALASWRGRG